MPVAAPAQGSVRNCLLAALSPADFSLLQPLLEPVPLLVRTCLAEANRPVGHVYFMEQGITSVVASAPQGPPHRAWDDRQGGRDSHLRPLGRGSISARVLRSDRWRGLGGSR